MRGIWLLAAAFVTAATVTACGDDGPPGSLPDAPPSVDAAMPDGSSTTGAVTVTVSTRGVPTPNVRVHFQRADSSVIASTLTDAAGVARADTERDSLVTVVTNWDTNIGNPVLTYAGVQPGDELVVDGPDGALRQYTVRYPADPGSTSQLLHSSCEGEPYPVTDNELRSQECPFPVDLLIESFDDAGGRRFLAASQQTPVDDTITMTGTYAPFAGQMSLQVVNIPSTITQSAQYLTFGNGYSYFTFAFIDAIANGTASSRFVLPQAAGTVKQDIILRNPNRNNHHIYSHYQLQGASSTLDVAATQLLVEYATPPTLDKATQTLSWTPGTEGLQPAFTYMMIVASRGEGDQRRIWTREMVMPYAGGTIALPRLPVEDFDYNLAATDAGGPLELYVSDLPYDSVRERFYIDWDPYDVLVPAPGTTVRHIEYIPQR